MSQSHRRALGTVTVDVKSDRPLTLEVIAPDGVTRQTIAVQGHQK